MLSEQCQLICNAAAAAALGDLMRKMRATVGAITRTSTGASNCLGLTSGARINAGAVVAAMRSTRFFADVSVELSKSFTISQPGMTLT